MIHLVDQMLEQALRAEVPLPRDVEVSFATPDRKWGATVTNPTVNLFLWDIRRDLERSHSGFMRAQRSDGTRVERGPDPVMLFRYLVTAWASEHRDEHQLLGAVLATVLRCRIIEATHMPVELGGLPTVEMELAPGDKTSGEFWSSLDGQLKPGLDIVVRLTVPLGVDFPLGPPITSVQVDVARQETAEADEPAKRDVSFRRVRRGRTVITTAVEGTPPS